MAWGATCPLLSTGQAPQRCNLQPSLKKGKAETKSPASDPPSFDSNKIESEGDPRGAMEEESKENSIPQRLTPGS